MHATLNSYVPLDASDNTVGLLEETFRYLPSEGRLHLAEDIIQDGTHYKLHQLAQSIVTDLLTPMKVAGAKTAGITPSPWLGRLITTELFDCDSFSAENRQAIRNLRA